jgi:glycerophosphoryl diester phosphodiesterase
MKSDISFWIINGSTIIILVSPLFLFVSYFIAILVVLIIPLTILFLYYYLSLSQSKSSINQFKNITIAHRGGRPLVLSTESDDFPENTMAAYRWASNKKGVDGIELDVWLSKDLIPMVSHDGYLEHTFAECKQFLSSLTCEQIKKLKYLKKNKRDIYDQIGCEIIPTLEEVIIFLEPTNLKLSKKINYPIKN